MNELTTNWVCDYDYRYRSVRNINGVGDIRRVDSTDYITLSEVKAYMKVDFTEEDTLITNLIKAARRSIENYTGLSLVPTTVTVNLINNKGGIEFPYGPVVGDITLLNDDGTEDEGQWEQTGFDFPTLTTRYSNTRASYDAGYTTSTLPWDLRIAIYQQVNFMYNNRGDGGVSETAKQLANPYKRTLWIL